MKPYADKLCVVLYFSVRSSRSNTYGRHFANKAWGESWVFIGVDEEGEKNGDLPGTQRSNRLSWQTNWELGKFLKWFAA